MIVKLYFSKSCSQPGLLSIFGWYPCNHRTNSKWLYPVWWGAELFFRNRLQIIHPQHRQRRELWPPAAPGTKVSSPQPFTHRTKGPEQNWNVNRFLPEAKDALSRKIMCWQVFTINGQVSKPSNSTLPHQHVRIPVPSSPENPLAWSSEQDGCEAPLSLPSCQLVPFPSINLSSLQILIFWILAFGGIGHTSLALVTPLSRKPSPAIWALIIMYTQLIRSREITD